MTNIKTYSELIKLPTFEERYEYLKLGGVVGATTFGYDRIFNQRFYLSKPWLKVRDYVIIRDNGCDLAHEDHPVRTRVIIHHINVITIDDILNGTDILLDPEFLVTTVLRTHNAIHYGDANLLPQKIVERTKNDTCPWKN